MSGRELERIEALAANATAGPWFYNSYSGILSEPMMAVEDEFWTGERLSDGHSYDHRVGEVCEACGPRFVGAGQVWDCALAPQALDADCRVAGVQASYGDTATGRRIADAQFIAAARTDVPALLAEVRRLRALELRVRALTTETGCRHDGEAYCGNAILEALDAPTPPVRPVDGGNP